MFLSSLLVGPADADPRVPCEDECRRVLTVCISDGTGAIVEPKPDDLAECVSLCRSAGAHRFYSCVFRQFYCGGLYPCFKGQ